MSRNDLLIVVYSYLTMLHKDLILNEDSIILDCGIDSLGYAHLMLHLEQISGKSPDENNINWGDINSIGKLVDLFV